MAATLASGLPPESRAKRALSGVRATQTELLLAGILDRLSQIRWMLSKDGRTGRNRPESLAAKLLGHGESEREKIKTYASAEAFEAARAKLLGN